MPPVPVLVAKVVQRIVPDQVHEIGTVEAYSSVAIKSRIEGQLVAIHFKEGDYVKQGQLLFELDPRPFEAALQQARANLAKDSAQARQANTEDRRYEYLLKYGVGSQDQRDQAYATAASMNATAAADRAAIQTAQLNLDYSKFQAPFDGKTGNLTAHIGDMIKADADTGLVTINQVEPIYVDFYIPEKRLGEVRRYMEERQLEVTAAVPGYEGPPERGVLSFVNNAVDSTTGQIELKGLFQNRNLHLWPGQFVNTTLTLTQHPETLLVPAQALQTGQNGTFVYVVGTNMKVEPRPIVTGAPVGGDMIVTDGLRQGETVVTDGQLRLAPGATVRIKRSLGSQGMAS